MDLEIKDFKFESAEFLLCRQVREKVFLQEQEVPLAIEFDGRDDQCRHFLAFEGTAVLGTSRLRPLNDEIAKVERVAVLKEARGKKVGFHLMAAMESYAFEMNFKVLLLHSQLSAKGFYIKQGYKVCGDVFYEADIPHVKMHKNKP